MFEMDHSTVLGLTLNSQLTYDLKKLTWMQQRYKNRQKELVEEFLISWIEMTKGQGDKESHHEAADLQKGLLLAYMGLQQGLVGTKILELVMKDCEEKLSNAHLVYIVVQLGLDQNSCNSQNIIQESDISTPHMHGQTVKAI